MTATKQYASETCPDRSGIRSTATQNARLSHARRFAEQRDKRQLPSVITLEFPAPFNGRDDSPFSSWRQRHGRSITLE